MKTLENEEQRLMWTWINQQRMLNTKRENLSFTHTHMINHSFQKRINVIRGLRRKDVWGREMRRHLEITFVQTVLYFL